MAGERLLKQGIARRKKIMRFLEKYIAKEGISPTFQEIADAVELVSPNATRNHLRRLELEGKIKLRPRVARGISLIDTSKVKVK